VLTPSLASLVELYFYIKRLINRSLSKWLLGCAISPYIRSPFAFPLLFFLVQPISSSTFWAVQHSLFISGGTADLQRSSFFTGRSRSQSLLLTARLNSIVIRP
jgi:hypothetical protein